MEKKIALFGTYPPPYGGRSVHLKRLAANLSDMHYTVHIYSNTGNIEKNSKIKLKKTKRIIFDLFRENFDIIHFHDRNFKLIFIITFFSKLLNYKTILTYHSFRDNPDKYGFINKNLFKFCIKRIDKFICVGINEKKKLQKYVLDKKITTIPGFIKPFENEEDKNAIPLDVWNFIDKQKFLISGNGNVNFYKNTDLYGIDMFIELVSSLTRRGYNVGLLFALLGLESQNNDEKNYYKSLKKKVVDLGLQEKVYFFEVKNSEFYPILKKTQLFIRPTNTDGFPLSLAEAISLKVPSIASDVIERPKETIIFKNRDNDDLLKKATSVIDEYDYYKKKLDDTKQEDYFTKLLVSYKNLVE